MLIIFYRHIKTIENKDEWKEFTQNAKKGLMEEIHVPRTPHLDEAIPRSHDLLKLKQKCFEKLISDYGSLFNNGLHSDFTINVGERKFPVHKCVLTVRSEVFKGIMNAATANQYSITNHDPEIIEAMLRFIYTANTSNLSTISPKLWLASNEVSLSHRELMT